jgi:hypothetical protein
MTDPKKLDDELSRLLEAVKLPPEVPERQQLQQTQHFTWPWQVPQVPAYTTDNTRRQRWRPLLWPIPQRHK